MDEFSRNHLEEECYKVQKPSNFGTIKNIKKTLTMQNPFARIASTAFTE